MSERKVVGLTYENIASTAVRPEDVTQRRWDTGMALVENLMKIGQPVNVPEKSSVGPNIPDTYYITGTGVTVEHTLGTDVAIVRGEERTIVTLPEVESSLGETHVHPAVTKLNEAIVRSWQ